MSKKKSMGHNPLGENHLEGAKFDLIPYTEKGAERKKKEETEKKTNKKVVSYYLEEELVKEIKTNAKKFNVSYSNLVSKILKRTIKQLRDK